MQAITPPTEIDSANVDELARLLECSTAPEVEVDCSVVTFIDSSGLRVLLETDRRLRESRRTLVLLEPSPVVTRLLEITDTTSVLTVRRAGPHR
jgi:anti-anti-sigma factor